MRDNITKKIIDFVEFNKLDLSKKGRDLNKVLCILCGYTCFLEQKMIISRGSIDAKIDLYPILLGRHHMSKEFQTMSKSLLIHARKYNWHNHWNRDETRIKYIY